MSNDKPKPGSLASVIGLAGSKAKVPVIQITRQRPLAAAISKAVAPTTTVRHTSDGSRIIDQPALHTLQQISNQTANNISQSDTTLQMIPDIELGAQILISAVTSPKDMMTLELSYNVTPGLLPPSLVSSLTTVLKRQFNDHYKIKNKLPRILREVLFDKGAHVVAIIPENSVDELINRNNSVALEAHTASINLRSFANRLNRQHSLAANRGTLGGGINSNAEKRSTVGDHIFGVGNEALSLNAYEPVASPFDQHLCLQMSTKGGRDNVVVDDVIITDNPDVLRGPEIEKELRTRAIRKKISGSSLSAGLESLVSGQGNNTISVSDKSLMAAIYKGRKTGVKPMQVLKTDNQLDRKSIGRPLVMELPPEAVIPVFTPGQEDKHVGYFILLDQTGNPVRAAKELDALGSMARRLNTATNQQQNVINRLQQLTEGFGCTNEQEHSDMMVRIYADMVEADLLARLRNGIYANSVALAKNPEYYRVMLTRVLSQQRTTVLFMPVDSMTYFARKYNKYGIGVSILDDMKVLNNMRGITTLANTMLGIRNSIPRTEVDLTIDETDPDPYKTAEMFLSEILRVNQTSVPLGASSPTDMIDFFQRAQYRMNIKGHPGIPDTNAEYRETNSNYSKVDTDLEKNLQDRSMMTMGLNSEIVNNGFNGSATATSVVADNLMLSRRVAILQEQLNPHITDYHRKIIRADEEIIDEMRVVLNQGYEELEIDEEEVRKELNLNQAIEIKKIVIDQLISEFVDKLEVTLPKPETATLENQKTALEGYIELLDIALDSYINDEFFSAELGGELSETTESIKKTIRAYFIRKYMAENGIMSDLSSIVTTDDNEEHIDFWEAQKNHIEALTKSLGGFMRKIHDVKKDENIHYASLKSDMDNLGETSGGGDSGFGSDSSDIGGDDPTGGDSGDDFGLGASLDLGDDLLDETGVNDADDDTTAQATTDTPPEA